LTLKLIDPILEAEGAGKIKRFSPVMDADESDIRELWMTPSLHSWCYENDGQKSLDYKRNLRAFLGRFVKGQKVDNRDYMKSWKKRIFELRVQLSPKPHNTRIFGGFVLPNTFVAINWKPRSYFGNKDDPRWDEQIDIAVHGVAAISSKFYLLSPKPFSTCVDSCAYDCDLEKEI
jgi:hypothetical protein